MNTVVAEHQKRGFQDRLQRVCRPHFNSTKAELNFAPFGVKVSQVLESGVELRPIIGDFGRPMSLNLFLSAALLHESCQFKEIGDRLLLLTLRRCFILLGVKSERVSLMQLLLVRVEQIVEHAKIGDGGGKRSR
jgi:hypothetical protein